MRRRDARLKEEELENGVKSDAFWGSENGSWKGDEDGEEEEVWREKGLWEAKEQVERELGERRVVEERGEEEECPECTKGWTHECWEDIFHF